MLDFRIQTFLCACRHMNFTRAAEELHITQPAVSQHIHYLEQLYGTRLFVCEGKKVRLTPPGEILLSTMTTLQNDELAMVKRMQQCSGQKRSLTFGVTLTIGEYVIVSPLVRYLKNHPDTDIHIKYANTAGLLSALHKGEIDFALVEGYFKADDYETLIYGEEEYIAACSSKHRFVKTDGIGQMADLFPERLLVREPGSGTRDILERNLMVRNISLSDFAHIVQVESMHTIVSLLVEDCGIAFLYKTAVQQELDRGTVQKITLEDFHMKHKFTFLWDKDSAFSADYAAICRELKGD